MGFRPKKIRLKNEVLSLGMKKDDLEERGPAF